MKKLFLLIYPFIIILGFSGILVKCDCCEKPEPFKPTPYNIPAVPYFPTILNIPADNPMTVEGVKLGRYLFYDGRMSGRTSVDSMMCCASCHKQENAFETGQGTAKYYTNGRPHGMPHAAWPTGKPTPHVALPLFNLVYNNTGYLWNGLISQSNQQLGLPAYGVPPEPQYNLKNIESLVWMSIVATHEFNGKIQNTVNAIKSDPMYPPMFKAAFGDEEITFDRIQKALAQFIRSIVSTDSKFQKWVRHEATLSQQELRGFEIFMTEKGDCFHCHGQQALLTTNMFFNNAKDTIFTGAFEDKRDRFHVTLDSMDLGAYKAPTLLNIELTGPYMHDGRFTTLEQVIDFYSEGQKYSPYVSSLMKYVHKGGVNLTASEKQDLLAFLKTLTDYTLLSNPDYTKPSDLTIPSE